MKRHIVDYYIGLVKYEDIVIGEIIGDDDRIGWKDCRHVCTKAFGSEEYPIPQCIGWCDLGDEKRYKFHLRYISTLNALKSKIAYLATHLFASKG